MGALGQVGRGFGSAGRAELCWGVGLAVLGVLGWVGRGFGSAGCAELCWGVGLAVLGVLGWVGRGIWLWWARWAGLGKVVVSVF